MSDERYNQDIAELGVLLRQHHLARASGYLAVGYVERAVLAEQAAATYDMYVDQLESSEQLPMRAGHVGAGSAKAQGSMSGDIHAQKRPVPFGEASKTPLTSASVVRRAL